MNNLLQESPNATNTEFSQFQNDTRENDIESGIVKDDNAPGDGGLAEFFPKVQEIKDEMENIRVHLKQLQDENEASKSITKPVAVQASKEKMESLVDGVIKITKNIKKQLEKLDEENLANRKKPGCGEGTGVDRSRMAMTISLKKKLQALMSEFQLPAKNLILSWLRL